MNAMTVLIQQADEMGVAIESSEPAITVSISAGIGPPGLSGDNTVFGETPNGTVNGSNATFTVDFNFAPDSVEVFVNGILQTLVTDYVLSGLVTIIFGVSPEVGDSIKVRYVKA